MCGFLFDVRGCLFDVRVCLFDVHVYLFNMHDCLMFVDVLFDVRESDMRGSV